MYIAVCDDDQIFSEQLVGMLKRIQKTSLTHRIKIFDSGDALLFNLDENFDLVFLDIELYPDPDTMSGLYVAEQIRKHRRDMPIVFVTAHDKYAIQGYEYHPYHYLLKPVQFHKLRQIVHEIEEKQRRNWDDSLNLKVKGGYMRIPKSEIIFMETKAHLLTIHTEGGAVKRYNVKISDMLNQLCDARFFSPHKSYAVNIEKIDQIVDGFTQIRLQNGVEIPISGSKKPSFLEYLVWYDNRASEMYEQSD